MTCKCFMTIVVTRAEIGAPPQTCLVRRIGAETTQIACDVNGPPASFCPFCGERYELAVPSGRPPRQPGESYFDYDVRVDAAFRLASVGAGSWNANFLEALHLFGLRLVRPDHAAVDITRHVCAPAPFGNEGAWPPDWLIVELDDPPETAGRAIAGAPGNPESDAPAPTAGVSDHAARSDIDARGTNCTGTGGSHDA